MESSRTYPKKFNFQSRNRLFIPCRQLPYCLRVGMCWPIGVPSPTHKIWRWQFWNLQFLHMESVPPRKNFTTELEIVNVRVRQIVLSYRPAKLHKLAESIPWIRFLGSLNVYKFVLWIYFSQGIDSVESISGVLESLKIRAQDSGGSQNNTAKK